VFILESSLNDPRFFSFKFMKSLGEGCYVPFIGVSMHNLDHREDND
jgi:hypothetical protein